MVLAIATTRGEGNLVGQPVPVGAFQPTEIGRAHV